MGFINTDTYKNAFISIWRFFSFLWQAMKLQTTRATKSPSKMYLYVQVWTTSKAREHVTQQKQIVSSFFAAVAVLLGQSCNSRA